MFETREVWAAIERQPEGPLFFSFLFYFLLFFVLISTLVVKAMLL